MNTRLPRSSRLDPRSVALGILIALGIVALARPARGAGEPIPMVQSAAHQATEPSRVPESSAVVALGALTVCAVIATRLARPAAQSTVKL